MLKLLLYGKENVDAPFSKSTEWRHLLDVAEDTKGMHLKKKNTAANEIWSLGTKKIKDSWDSSNQLIG